MLFRHQNDSSTSNLHQMFCEIKNVRLSSRWLPLRMIYDAPQTGLEPVTSRLTVDCSTIELLRNKTGTRILSTPEVF